MYSLTITSVLFVYIVIATTESKPAKDNQHIFNIQACGKELADLLSSTCNLGYNTQTKTFIPSASADENLKENNSVDNESNSISQEKRKIHKRGIIQDCCVQPCRWHDLLAYCYNGSSMNVKPLIDKLEALGVKVMVESPLTFVFRPADSKVNPEHIKNNELYRKLTETKINEIRSNSKDVEAITLKTTPNTSEKPENITGNERGINGHIKSITPYHYRKTPIIVDNRPLTMLSQPQV